MKIRRVRIGSRREIVLGFCCPNPFTFSQWGEGKEHLYLKGRKGKQTRDKSQDEE